jgi:hypothetical protein
MRHDRRLLRAFKSTVVKVKKMNQRIAQWLKAHS